MGTLKAQYGKSAFNTRKDPCRVATIAALPACTYAPGVLTSTANGSLNTLGIDSKTDLAVNQDVLVKNQADQTQNGPYTIVALGVEDPAGSPWSLRRRYDFDASEKIQSGDAIPVQEGTINDNTEWVLRTDGSITLDSSSLVFGSHEADSGPAFSGYVQTTDATETTLVARTIPDGHVRTLEARVDGRKADGSAAFGAKIAATFRAAGGVATLVGTPTVVYEHKDDNSDPENVMVVRADASTSTGRIRVVGKVGTTVDWYCNGQETIAYAP